jgi:hypothetical protein
MSLPGHPAPDRKRGQGHHRQSPMATAYPMQGMDAIATIRVGGPPPA